MPDERAVMTYVSSYYHCFSGAQKVCLFTDDHTENTFFYYSHFLMTKMQKNTKIQQKYRKIYRKKSNHTIETAK